MKKLTPMMQTQVEGYLLLHLEWRLAVQEFIDFHAGEEGNWVAQFEDNQLMLNIYNDEDTQTEALRFSPLGSYDKNSETWLWAWANPYFSVLTSRRSSTAKKYGEKYKIDELAISHQKVSEEQVEVYPIINAAVYGGNKPIIWLPSENGHKLCVLVEDELTLPDVTQDTFIQIIKTVSAFTDDFADLKKSVTAYAQLRRLPVEESATFTKIGFKEGNEVTVSFNETHGTITSVKLLS